MVGSSMAQFPGHKLASLSKHTTLPYPYRYHVFLSFRGEDTRKNFTDHLYSALINAGFHTFRDDPELERGENIKEKLGNAILQSRSSIIVFSKDYTSSRWCLDELVMILERKRTSDHAVFPVFYDVNPSQVRKQAETLANKYQEHQSPEKLHGWRAALREVADLAGMVLENEVDGHESKFIHKIVGVIQDKLGRVSLKDVEEVLQKKLLFIDPFIDDAEGKQLNNPTVKAWLTDLKEAGYDMEDLLQKIKTEALWEARMEAESASEDLLQESKTEALWEAWMEDESASDEDLLLEIKTEALWEARMEADSASSTSQVQELNSSLPTLGFDLAFIQSRVQEVLNRIDSIMDQRRDVMGLEASVGYRVSQTLPTTSLVEDSGVYGRYDEKEKLIQLLLSHDESGNKISAIPILGMGGIGKTTLAQLLYNDVRVKKHFDIRAWACVSEKFDVVRISQQVYESLTSDACNILNLNVLQEKLVAALMGKKFLLILDDVWSKNYGEWDVLRRPFQFGAHGSKIIVTTRNQDVASMVRTLEAHCLMPMSEEDGWSLFEKHAFKNAGVGGQSLLEKIGRQIVRKCKGLPLAIKSLGGLLCSKSNADEWETILKSQMWELPQESDILPSLWLSYIHLPLELKRCFAYCSIFPKNYTFEGSSLILLWKAVGLLQPGKKKSAEEIGRDYFNDLISRSFFQHSPTNREVESYSMHDLINDLASFVSGEFCARCEGSDSPKILSKTRHVNADFYTFDASHQLESLRTLLLKGYISKLRSRKGHLINLLPELHCLIVLKLSGEIEELPDSIKNLKHLSHLDLSWSGIKKLPDTICSLYNLQALLLVHCFCLIELPAHLGRLINLSHLDITGTELIRMPPNMGNLKNLRTLPQFVLDRVTARYNLPELDKLQSLRGRLYISGLEHSSRLEAYILREKKFLNELELEWRSRKEGDIMFGWTRMSAEVLNEESIFSLKRVLNEESEAEERGVLEKLQPHLNLKRLTISGYRGTMFPGWRGFYSSSALVHLTLKDCIKCVSLPPFGQLPYLKELEINGLDEVVSIGSEFYYARSNTSTHGNEPFRSLQSLKFEYMRGWKEWCTFVGGEDIVTFPKLTTLSMFGCKKLSSLPENMHSHLPSLLSLSMQNCKALECIREGGFPSKLRSLHIVSCTKLKMNSDCLRRLTSLKELKLDVDSDEKREDWIASEDEGLLPSSLTDLEISGLKCETIDGAKWFGHLNSLQYLRIGGCLALRCLPDSGLPPSLGTLKIIYCPEIQCLPDSGLPPSLVTLKIMDCSALQRLPDSGLPPSLRMLEIHNCSALQRLPDSGLPPSLSQLWIRGCALLEKRCQRETGGDWPKIAHIPYIDIGGRRVEPHE